MPGNSRMSAARALFSMKLVANTRLLRGLLLALLVGFILLDRGYWAEVAQWREDQSCNLWLGYTRGPLQLPVGLISSVGTPNPNGMPLLALLLSRLPNLWAISLALGALQGGLVVWVCWQLTGANRWLLLAVAPPALASVILRGSSVEFWNQWMLVDLNMWFFGLWVRYLRKPTPWRIAWLTLPMLIAPALYLGGLLNAVVYFLFAVGALWKRPPRCRPTRWIAPVVAGLSWLGLAVGLTWIPFARAMRGQQLPGTRLSEEVVTGRLRRALTSALEFPSWSLFHWYDSLQDSFLHSNVTILEPATYALLLRTRSLLLAQGILFLLALFLAAEAYRRRRQSLAGFFVEGNRFGGKMLLAGVGFVATCTIVSPLLGGAFWTRSDRPDQQVQLLPFLLFAWFLLPLLLNLPRPVRWTVGVLSWALTITFTASSIRNGWQIVGSHLGYRGSQLSLADVPLEHQERAIAFIAHDWKTVSKDRRVPAVYEHGQDWANDFGRQLERWYPAPMTVGRAFDYELLRVHRLRNSQEGTQVRRRDGARYLVTYGFRDPPTMSGMKLIHHDFGRVRVSVVQAKPRTKPATRTTPR